MKKLVLLLFCITLLSCDQLQEIVESAGQAAMAPTETEVKDGIKEALTVGITNAVFQTSKEDGFLNNSLIKIPFPPEAAKVERAVRNIGLGSKVDQFVETLNHGAEKAAEKATPIFSNAIRQMTIQDVYNIWRGDKNAATQYLKQATQNDLKTAFRPVIQNALDQVQITKYWNPVINTYNQIPLVQKMNPDLDDYVLEETLDGLFIILAQEEEKIREDPIARVSDLLRKVFGYEGPSSFN